MDTGFFKWVWRFNALVIAAAVSLLLGVILWEVTSDLRRSAFAPATRETIVLADPQAPAATPAPRERRRYFAAPATPNRKGLYALPLYVEQEFDNRGITKGSDGNLVNYRIVDTNTQTNRWLFNNSDRLILDTKAVYLKQTNAPARLLGRMLAVIEQDTNEDGRLSNRDTRSLYFSDAGWSIPVKITTDVTRLIDALAIDNDTLHAIFNTAKGTHFAQIALPSAQIASEQVITTAD